jgi:hypothetical protein
MFCKYDTFPWCPCRAYTCCAYSEVVSFIITSSMCHLTNKLCGLSPSVNYTNRVTATCWQSYCQRLRIEGATWSVTDPYAHILGFLDQNVPFAVCISSCILGYLIYATTVERVLWYKWHIHTKFHNDSFRNLSNIKGISSTIWEPVVLVLQMKGVS